MQNTWTQIGHKLDTFLTVLIEVIEQLADGIAVDFLLVSDFQAKVLNRLVCLDRRDRETQSFQSGCQLFEHGIRFPAFAFMLAIEADQLTVDTNASLTDSMALSQ